MFKFKNVRGGGNLLEKNTYNRMIDEIKFDSSVVIGDKEYKVLSKTFYSNLNNRQLKYVKFVLNNDKILVVNPERESIFLGEVVDDFYKDEYFPKSFEYEGKTFVEFEKDIQIVNKIEFGEPAECEGECVWVDYVCQEDKTICIDMAYIYRDKKRADILAKWIDIKTIKVKN